MQANVFTVNHAHNGTVSTCDEGPPNSLHFFSVFCGIKFPAAVMEISFVLNLTVNQCDEDEQRVFVRWRFAAFSSLQPRALWIVHARMAHCKCHHDSWMARVPAAVDQLYNVRVSLVICTSWTKVGLSQIALHLWTGGSSLKYLLQLEGPRTILCASEKGRKTKALSEAS